MAHGIMPNYGEMDGGNEPVRARMSLGWKKIGLAVCLAGLGGVLMGAASDSKNSLRQILLAEGGLLSEGALLRDLRAGGKEEEEEISGAERRQQPMVKGLAKMVREVMWEKLKTGEDAGKKIPREEDVLNLKRRVASSEATNTPVATVKDLPADLTGAGVDYDEEFASSAETAQVTAAKAHPTDKRVNIFHKKEPGPSRTAAPVSTNKASGRGFGGEDAVGDGRRQAVKHAPISAIKTARDTLDNDLWLSLADANSSVADTAAAAAAQNDTSAFPTESARASSDSNNGSSKKSKVIVKLYMESRCPACKNYVGEIVSSVLLAQGMKDIMDFKLVPWGNAEVMKNGTQPINTTSSLQEVLDGKDFSSISFNCQHGPSECAGNAWESCIQHLYPDTSFPVLHCIETKSCAEGERKPLCQGMPADVARQCLSQGSGVGMKLGDIASCVNGEMGSTLLVQNALDTESLSPKRQWVPWVTVDGKHLGDKNPVDIYLLGKAVCQQYAKRQEEILNANGTASGLPAGCATFPQEIPSAAGGGNQVIILGVCAGIFLLIVAVAIAFYRRARPMVPNADAESGPYQRLPQS